jgi:hypothetical protein
MVKTYVLDPAGGGTAGAGDPRLGETAGLGEAGAARLMVLAFFQYDRSEENAVR